MSLFRQQVSLNMYAAGDPSVDDEVAYTQTVTRTTRSPYLVDYRMRHESQVITAMSVLPMNENLQSPEVEIIEGGVNWRHVKMRLTPASEGRWGCDIKICGSPAP